MHIVVLAWLYILLTMAMTLRSPLAGIALFVIVGCGPVLLVAALALRRRRARRASVLQHQVRAADDRDP